LGETLQHPCKVWCVGDKSWSINSFTSCRIC